MTTGFDSSPLLAIETATSVCSCAVIKTPRVIFERSLKTDRKHGEVLPGLVQTVCGEANVRLDSISCIAVSIGPGSFTGLRVGLSFAKGIAAFSGAFILPVGTLEGLAFRIAEAGVSPLEFTACPLVIARRGEAFGRLFKVSGRELKAQSEIFLLKSLKSLREELKPIWIGGEGAEMLRDSERVSEGLSKRGKGASEKGNGSEVGFKYLEGMQASAAAVGQIGWEARAAGVKLYRSEEALTPNYAAEFTIKKNESINWQRFINGGV